MYPTNLKKHQRKKQDLSGKVVGRNGSRATA